MTIFYLKMRIFLVYYSNVGIWLTPSDEEK